MLSTKKPLVLAFAPEKIRDKKYKELPTKYGFIEFKLALNFDDLGEFRKQTAKDFPGIKDFRVINYKLNKELKAGLLRPYALYKAFHGVVLHHNIIYLKRVRLFLASLGLRLYALDSPKTKRLRFAEEYLKRSRVFSFTPISCVYDPTFRENFLLARPTYLANLAEREEWATLADRLYEEGTGLLLSRKQFSEIRFVDIFRSRGVSLFRPVFNNRTLMNVEKVWPYL